MARYPPPIKEKGWVSLLDRLSRPTSEEHNERIIQMAENGKKIKVNM